MLNKGDEEIWCPWDENGNWQWEKNHIDELTFFLDEFRVIYLSWQIRFNFGMKEM